MLWFPEYWELFFSSIWIETICSYSWKKIYFLDLKLERLTLIAVGYMRSMVKLWLKVNLALSLNHNPSSRPVYIHEREFELLIEICPMRYAVNSAIKKLKTFCCFWCSLCEGMYLTFKSLYTYFCHHLLFVRWGPYCKIRIIFFTKWKYI